MVGIGSFPFGAQLIFQGYNLGKGCPNELENFWIFQHKKSFPTPGHNLNTCAAWDRHFGHMFHPWGLIFSGKWLYLKGNYCRDPFLTSMIMGSVVRGNYMDLLFWLCLDVKHGKPKDNWQGWNPPRRKIVCESNVSSCMGYMLYDMIYLRVGRQIFLPASFCPLGGLLYCVECQTALGDALWLCSVGCELCKCERMMRWNQYPPWN